MSEMFSGTTPFSEDRSVLSRPAPSPDAMVRFGDRAENIADIRFGKRDPEIRPLIVLIHGGYWRPQIDRTHAGSMSVAITEAGWTVASIEYSRIPGNPDATLKDVALAITEIPVHVSDHNGTMLLIGHSAGGQLALWAAATCKTAVLKGVLALGPVADLQWGEAHAVGDHAVRDFLGTPASQRPDIDPCLLPSPSIAVTLIHGVEDSIAPIAMSENYCMRHPRARLIKLNDCGHFALIDPLSHAWPQVIAQLQLLSQL
jgi:acetyl esterase/lipase